MLNRTRNRVHSYFDNGSLKNIQDGDRTDSNVLGFCNIADNERNQQEVPGSAEGD